MVNLCRACREDFGSVGAFDAHRTGKHAYSFREGLALDPPVEDGRRCFAASELREKGWSKDSRGRWRQPIRANKTLLRSMYARSRAETAGDR